MKLDRISKIRGHRIFDHFAWPADLEPFGRFNLIYGWNGSGTPHRTTRRQHGA